jgi:hypothetical protein
LHLTVHQSKINMRFCRSCGSKTGLQSFLHRWCLKVDILGKAV